MPDSASPPCPVAPPVVRPGPAPDPREVVAPGPVPPSPFRSFWQGGFDCGHLFAHHDLLESTGHVPARHMRAHYRTVLRHGLLTLRDGLPPGADPAPRLRIARETGAQVIWDAMHFHRIDQKAAERHGEAIGRAHAAVSDPGAPLWLCPNNEVEVWPMFRLGPVAEAVRIWQAIRDGVLRHAPQARFITSSVLNSVHGPWEGIDALAPHAEVIGLNPYPHTLRHAIHRLLIAAHERTGRPVMISKTSFHTGHPRHHRRQPDKRAWADHVARQVAKARAAGVPVWGACWYQIVNCPPWDRPRARIRWDHGLIRPDQSVDPGLSDWFRERSGLSGTAE